MERMELEQMKYNALEASIHLNRYMIAEQFCKGKRILDAACGEGYGSYLLSTWGAEKVYGIDISEEAIEHARKSFGNEDIEFLCEPVENISSVIEEKSIDLVVSLETIEHLQDPLKYLAEIKKILKPDGIIIVSCPNDYYYYPRVDQSNPFHIRKYTFNEFKDLTESVLGTASTFFYGVQVNGYMNLEKEECQNDSFGKGTQINMLSTSKKIECILAEKDEAINDFHTSYYVGIWGMKEDAIMNRTASIYPHPHDWIYLMDNLKAEISNLEKLNYNKDIDVENLTKEYKKCEDKLADLERRLNNKGIQLEVANAENNLLKKEVLEIKNSNGYKMLAKYYSLRDKIRR